MSQIYKIYILELYDYSRLFERFLQLESTEEDLVMTLSVVLTELEEKLNEYENGVIKTTDLDGKPMKYSRGTHKFAKIYEQFGDHSRDFVKSVSWILKIYIVLLSRS